MTVARSDTRCAALPPSDGRYPISARGLRASLEMGSGREVGEEDSSDRNHHHEMTLFLFLRAEPGSRAFGPEVCAARCDRDRWKRGARCARECGWECEIPWRRGGSADVAATVNPKQGGCCAC
jgi:hypothetical protein